MVPIFYIYRLGDFYSCYSSSPSQSLWRVLMRSKRLTCLSVGSEASVLILLLPVWLQLSRMEDSLVVRLSFFLWDSSERVVCSRLQVLSYYILSLTCSLQWLFLSLSSLIQSSRRSKWFLKKDWQSSHLCMSYLMRVQTFCWNCCQFSYILCLYLPDCSLMRLIWSIICPDSLMISCFLQAMACLMCWSSFAVKRRQVGLMGFYYICTTSVVQIEFILFIYNGTVAEVVILIKAWKHQQI